ncbi:MAG: hypothetical protein K9K30_02160 [Burkholderiaceae bacterium]|nr:hypothetical protein [Sulfuritalea sp.]MCF8174019.1 hypothetical protein [Burkholderiaceae bacterium]MCF8184410.1 hypothetical protein [Polynucleobacter sp.]
MKNPLQTVGLLIFLSPIAITVLGFGVCAVYPTQICLAVPFAWMFFSPAFLLGAIIMLVAFLRSRKQKPPE